MHVTPGQCVSAPADQGIWDVIVMRGSGRHAGYNDAPAVQAQPAGFSFGFNVDANAAAAASVSNGNADAQPADELPSAKKQKRSKTDKQSQDQQVPHAG